VGWLGVVFQVLGLVVAGVGLADSWRQFGPAEPFLAPVHRSIERVVRGLSDATRRALGRPRSTTVRVGAADAAVGIASNASVKVRYGPVPTGDVEAALEILTRRDQELRSAIEDLGDRLAETSSGSTAQIGALTHRVEDDVARLEATDKRIASGGIRLAAVGLGAAAIGTFLQATGS
jgi:hypothetical protein